MGWRWYAFSILLTNDNLEEWVNLRIAYLIVNLLYMNSLQ